MTEVGAGVYAGLRCADCAFSEFVLNEESGMFEGACARGYTLADPHVHVSPDRFFAKNPRALVPVTDPYGREYLRTRNICTRFAPREGWRRQALPASVACVSGGIRFRMAGA